MRGITVKNFIIIIPLFLIQVLYSSKTIDPVLLPKYVAFSFYVLFVSGLTLYHAFVKKVNYDYAILRRNVFKYFAGYLIISAISLLVSRNPADGIFEWCKIALFFSFLLVAALYFQRVENLVEPVTKTVSVLSLTINVIGLYQFYQLANSVGVTHSSTYLVDGTFANRNLFAEILLLTLPFVTFGAYTFKIRWKVLCTFCFLSSVFLITITLSRAVWIALIISTAFTALVWLIVQYHYIKSNLNMVVRRIAVPGAIVLIAIGAAVFFYGRLDTEETFKKQFVSIPNLKYGAVKERVELWKKSFDIIRDEPLTGIGLSSWKIEILKYGVKGTRAEDALTFYQQAHNDFIMVAAEQGVFGLLFYLLIFITILYYILIILKNSSALNDKLFYLFVLNGIAAFCIISLFSFPKERIEHNIILMFMFILVVIKYHRVKTEKAILNESNNIKKKVSAPLISGYFLPSAFILIVVLFCTSVGIKRIKSDMHAEKALKARSQNHWMHVIKEVDKAASGFYQMDPMSTPLAWYRGSANFNLNRIEEAFIDFKRAYQLNPYHIHVLNNLGTYHEIKKDHDIAIEYFKKATTLNPAFEDALLNLSASYFNSGKINESYQTIRKCDVNSGNARYKSHAAVIVKAKFRLLEDSLKSKYLNKEFFNLKASKVPAMERFKNLDPKKLTELYISNFKEGLGHITTSESWMLELHKKSVENSISLEDQIFLDSIYILEVKKKELLSAKSNLNKTNE